MTEVYKVLRESKGRLTSICLSNYLLYYEKDVETVPIIGKIFAVDTLAHAKRLFHANVTICSEIWRCEVPDGKIIEAVFLATPYSSEDYKLYWEQWPLLEADSMSLFSVDDGTVFVNSLIPIECVYKGIVK